MQRNVEHDAQAQAAVLFEVAERELRPSWFDAQANLDRELTAVAKLSARACYVLFLLAIFSLLSLVRVPSTSDPARCDQVVCAKL